MAGDSHSLYYYKQKQKKIKKGLWSPEEDQKLFTYIIRFGVGSWTSVPQLAGLERCGKSCRLRWVNYLRPDLKRGGFSQQEQDIILTLHQLLGNRWAQIATKLPGRTDNEIKNFWNSCLKKKLIKNGIDPKTHKPIIDPKEVINENKSNKFQCKPVPNICPNPSPLISSMPMTDDQFEQAAFPNLTYKDNFMTTNNFLLGEFETGFNPVSLEYCNLLAHEYDQQTMNCETTSLPPSNFDFSDNLSSRSVMDTFINYNKESSICSKYSNMVNNHSAELLMKYNSTMITKYEEECPAEVQLQEAQHEASILFQEGGCRDLVGGEHLDNIIYR